MDLRDEVNANETSTGGNVPVDLVGDTARVFSTVLASADAVKHTASAFVDGSETSFPRAQIAAAALGLQSARQHSAGRGIIRELSRRREASCRAEVPWTARLILRLV